MGDHITLAEISAEIAPRLVSVKDWNDASYINLPMSYPSGAFVTVRLSFARTGIRVSDAGFAYREIESFGAGRSFARTAQNIAESYDVEVAKRSIYVDVEPHMVERAIFDVSSASYLVAEKIISNIDHDKEALIADALHQKLNRIFEKRVHHNEKIVGASSTEWDFTSIAKMDGKTAIFQAVTNYPVSVYKASTAFHDVAALDNPPVLISVVSNKAAMGKNYSILAQASRVIEISQEDRVFERAAA